MGEQYFIKEFGEKRIPNSGYRTKNLLISHLHYYKNYGKTAVYLAIFWLDETTLPNLCLAGGALNVLMNSEY
jgi:hypothetical protein